MKVYWRDECEYCVNKKGCRYIKDTKNFKEALYYMGKSAKGIYGRLRFNCDYFVIDEEEVEPTGGLWGIESGDVY